MQGRWASEVEPFNSSEDKECGGGGDNKINKPRDPWLAKGEKILKQHNQIKFHWQLWVWLSLSPRQV